MISFITNNLSTIIVAVFLLYLVVMIIKSQIKTKHECGCGCSSCPMAGKCHTKK
ncbi:MAG: FeoB-associated Cys-rich membrane protein [Coprobacillus sp.]